MGDVNNFTLKEKINVKHIGQVGAGTTVELFSFARKKQITRPRWAKGVGDIATADVCGDSLSDEGIHDGDTLVCKIIFEKAEITDGKLVVVKLPCGRSVVKRIYFVNEKIILRSSNSFYKDLVYEKGDIEVEGIVKRLERDIE